MSGYVYGASRHKEEAVSAVERLRRTAAELDRCRVALRRAVGQRNLLESQLSAVRRERERRIKAAQKRAAPNPNAPAVDYSPDACLNRLRAAANEADRWRDIKITLPETEGDES